MYLICEVVLFQPVLLPLTALWVGRGLVFSVFFQLQTHLLQFSFMTQQLLLLQQSQPKHKPPNPQNSKFQVNK